MGSKNKLKRFKENDTFGIVFQPTREKVVSNLFPLRGKWNQDYFKNNNPIVLELGCVIGIFINSDISIIIFSENSFANSKNVIKF